VAGIDLKGLWVGDKECQSFTSGNPRGQKGTGEGQENGGGKAVINGPKCAMEDLRNQWSFIQ